MSRSDHDSLPQAELRYVSTAQVAKALGVSVTTVKRWVDDHILPAHRTAGGHRKLLLADVLRLMREGNLPQADLSSLVARPHNVDLADPKSIHDQLAKAVRALDAQLVRAIIHGAYQNGYPLETIADRVIAPVMHEVGQDWLNGRVDITYEHRATQAVVSALYELKSVLRGQQLPGRPVAIGGAPEFDHYILPSLLCKLVLLDAGWDAIHLGPHTPMVAFTTAIEQLNPQLIWISVTHLQDPDRFIREYKPLHELAQERGVAIALGGRALTDPIRQQLNYTTFGDGLSQLASFARTMHRMPTRPRRGRPRLNRNEAAGAMGVAHNVSEEPPEPPADTPPPPQANPEPPASHEPD